MPNPRFTFRSSPYKLSLDGEHKRKTIAEGAAMSTNRRRTIKTSKNLLSDNEQNTTVEKFSKLISDGLNHTDDLRKRDLTFNGVMLRILFIDSAINKQSLQENIITPLQNHRVGAFPNVVGSTHVNETDNLDVVISALAEGSCVLISDESESFCLIPIPKEAVNREEPLNEKIIRGSHQGFSENMNEGIQFIRDRITSSKLTVKLSTVGETSKTKYALLYLSHLTNPELIKKIQNRISYIKADSIQSPGYFEEFIEDNSFSPFPQFLSTERPDRVAANLMEGRAVLLMEGSPTALVFPVSFFSFLQTAEDYNLRPFISSFIRIIRFISFVIALTLPAFYIAVISYNYEVIPVEIIFSIKSSLEFVPFPPLIEAAIMQLTLELLREASIRLPNPIAQTIGVVGGLVIGTAVVEANFVSNTMVIVVAITAISSFVIPSNELSTAIRILGFPLMIFAAVFGAFGIVIGLMIILIHMSTLKSLGHFYLYPIAPLDLGALKDTFIRLPTWLLSERPKPLGTKYAWRTSYPKGWKKDEESS